jgi:hypothetical protein
MFVVCAKGMQGVPRVRVVAHALVREFERLKEVPSWCTGAAPVGIISARCPSSGP